MAEAAAAAAALAAAELDAARRRVSGLADALAIKTTFVTFNENLWGPKITCAVASGARANGIVCRGEDFRRSLLTRLEVAPAAEYTDAMMLLDSAQAAPARILSKCSRF